MGDDPVLMLGDCLDRLREVPDGSVDLVLCDLPYGTTRNKWDAVIPFAPLWDAYRRVCRGAVVLTAQAPFSVALAASNLSEFRYEWIWEKTEATGHLNAKRMPMKAHENILVFYRTLPTFNPQKTTGHARKTSRSDAARDASTCYGRQAGLKAYDSTERYPRSVLLFSTDKQRAALHPTQKPVALMDYLIRTYTDPGDCVLDNCMGSGSTGVAAIRCNRRFVGIELDPEYFARASERIRQERETLLADVTANAAAADLAVGASPFRSGQPHRACLSGRLQTLP